jgi:uncharacterized membrane protein
MADPEPRSELGSRRLNRGEWLLLGAVAFAIAFEAFQEAADIHRPAWYVLPAAALFAALLMAWRWPEEIRPAVVVGLSLLLYAGFYAVHRAVGPPLTDIDISLTYPREGSALLDTGGLPWSEYPPGAVLLFGLAHAIGPMYLTLPALTLPILLAGWWALASARPGAAWIVASVALLPTLPFFWEVKFDAVPTGLFVLGMVAAYRERWALAGLALGFGAATKWWPALVVITLAAALVGRHDLRSLGRLAAGAAVGPLLVYLPFLGSDHLLTPYRFQTGRHLIGESLPFLPVHLLGFVGRPAHFYTAAGAPAWADTVATAVQLTAMAAIVVAAWRRPAFALPLAATSVVAFFVLNRVFSAQFMLPLAAAWACALVLADARPRRRSLRWFLGLLGATAIANYAVYPVNVPRWIEYEWVLFAAAIAATVVVVRAVAPRAATTQKGGP